MRTLLLLTMLIPAAAQAQNPFDVEAARLADLESEHAQKFQRYGTLEAEFEMKKATMTNADRSNCEECFEEAYDYLWNKPSGNARYHLDMAFEWLYVWGNIAAANAALNSCELKLGLTNNRLNNIDTILDDY